MRLSTNQVKGIISDLREQGYNVGVRDIAYVFLCRYFEEHVETWQNPRSLDVLMEVFD